MPAFTPTPDCFVTSSPPNAVVTLVPPFFLFLLFLSLLPLVFLAIVALTGSTNQKITLDTSDPAEKLAYSCALAQSSKLFVFEERLDSTIELTAKYPEMLAATGKIPLTEAQIG